MNNLTQDQQNKLAELHDKHETLRAAYIARDGEIDIFRQYPDLDAIASEMFAILSGGTGFITLSAEWVEENATEVYIGTERVK